MARPLRYVPPDSLVEVTCRTLHGRFLLRPSRALNEIVLGILGRATRRYRVGLCAFAYLSNHCHLLARPAPNRGSTHFGNSEGEDRLGRIRPFPLRCPAPCATCHRTAL